MKKHSFIVLGLLSMSMFAGSPASAREDNIRRTLDSPEVQKILSEQDALNFDLMTIDDVSYMVNCPCIYVDLIFKNVIGEVTDGIYEKKYQVSFDYFDKTSPAKIRMLTPQPAPVATQP